MKIEIFKSPSPHVVIDDFLKPKIAKKLLEECIQNKSKFRRAQQLCNCKDCQGHFEKYFRSTEVWMINEEPRNNILKTLDFMYFEYEFFKEACKEFPAPLNMIPLFNFTQETVSSYGKCNFYDWHTDNHGQKYPGRRLVTAVYYVNKEPAKFTGGELFYAGPKLDINYKTIIPKHNRLVIFPSDQYHCVDTVTNTVNFDESRFSIQSWMGYYIPEGKMLGAGNIEY